MVIYYSLALLSHQSEKEEQGGKINTAHIIFLLSVLNVGMPRQGCMQ